MTDRDDYLWDGSGEPDPEVQRLEELLSPLAFDRPLAALPERPDELARARARRRRRVWIAAGAAAACAVAAMWVLARERPGVVAVQPDARRGDPDVRAWRVVPLAGVPSHGGAALSAPGVLAIGEWLETGADARAEVAVADIGTVVVEPGSRLRRTASSAKQHRLELARGAIDAVVTAPPRLFVVDTPSASAVDLGCAYTLAVDERGHGHLRVTSGYVALEREDRVAFVPAGASCHTRAGIGPGTPFATGAGPALRAALDELDFADGGRPALERVLALAGERDTVTLWNLLSRLAGDDRALVYERLAALAPPPEWVTRDQVLRGDDDALLTWRMALEERWDDELFDAEGWDDGADSGPFYVPAASRPARVRDDPPR